MSVQAPSSLARSALSADIDSFQMEALEKKI